VMLDKLGSSLQQALKKIAGAGRIDKELVNEVVRDIQRALLQADVNVKLVMDLSQKIKTRALQEKPPAGMSPREHVIRIVYEELVGIAGTGTPISLRPQTIMMVGLQGSGKTTTTAKLARYFQRKGLKPGVICADTWRPGAYEQLSTLSQRLGIPFYGEEDGKNAPEIVKRGLESLAKTDVKIIDTAGRHALETDLIREMEEINRVARPEHRFLVLDAAIGQQAKNQARAFHESIGITGVIISKLDGTAKGGGALSAVSETRTSIAFLGTGETLEDLEKYEADRFISRLLGMGDLKSLIERAEEALKEEEIDVESVMRGPFTLKDMYKQMEAVSKLGPLKQVMQMIPMGKLGVKLTDEAYDVTKDRLERFKIIMDSMTEEEMLNPKIISGSRISRISRGSGSRPEEVRELLKYHRTMQKAFKGMRSGKFNLQRMMKKMGM